MKEIIAGMVKLVYTRLYFLSKTGGGSPIGRGKRLKISTGTSSNLVLRTTKKDSLMSKFQLQNLKLSKQEVEKAAKNSTTNLQDHSWFKF